MMKQQYNENEYNCAKRFKFAENLENENPDETISSIDDNPSSPAAPQQCLTTGTKMSASTPQTTLPLGSLTNKFPFNASYPSQYSQYNYNYYQQQQQENYNNFNNYYQQHNYNQMMFNPRLQINNNNRNSIGSSGSSDTSNSSLNLNSPSEFTTAYTTTNDKSNSSSSSSVLNTSQSQIRKRKPIPVENKDDAYWEKRRKNNESAKRSRDMRRNKEEHISIRVIYLEQENLQLKTELALVRNECEKLRAMLYAASNSAAAAAVAVAATANSVNH
ncbi:unnamed protein product [Brachionus calyciflorus]|uniref:BZIP domain-containing protein n=1 Tax=Brachionus calyciflorus TaxID=104777 RepID=A0A813MBE2_9BILA|nr:unnamed protein product [Brachionus calyciflorus]